MKDSRDLFISTAVQKLRIAVRSLARERHFSIVVILTLSITFAGLAVMAALVHSVLFKPLPYPEPDRLVVVWEKDDRFPVARGRELRTADFIDFRRDARQFESIGLYRRSINDVEINGSPVRTEVWSVSASVLPMLGASAVAGRLFTTQDEEPDAPKTILLSYEYWEKSFGRNPGIIGTTIFLPRHMPATIVGVLPPGLQAPAIGTLKTNAQLGFDAPQTFPVIWQVYQPTQDEIAVRTRGGYNGIGRLSRNGSLSSAGEELRGFGQNLARQYPESNSGITPLVSPLIEEVSGEFKSALWVLLVAVACVLMIGVGNLASLQVVRNTSRFRELSIRAALGASTSRLVTELLMESAVLVSIAGLLGLLAGGLALRALIPLLPAGFPRIGEIAMNGTAMEAVFAAAVIAIVALGAIPALRVRRADGLATLQTWSRSTASKYQTAIRRTVIAIETALAFVLLISAGLLLNSWYRLVTTPTGLDETNVTAVSLSLSPNYVTKDQQVAFFLKALDATRTYGAIEEAGIVTSPPLAGLEAMWPEIKPKGREGQTGSGVTLSLRAVTPDYFRVFRISPLQGEIFSGQETAKSEQVIVLNESGARALFGTEDPIGKAIVSFGISYRVIGVVPDVKMRRLDMAATPQAYASYLQWPSGSDAPVTIVFRTKNPDRNIGAVIHTRIATLDPDVAVTTNTLGDIRWQKTATERFRTTLFLLFALVALVLSLIGIFGLVSYAVAQRRREIGIRIAIGANTKSVIYLMTGQSLIPAGIGIVMGFVASLWLTRFISGFVFAISTTDAVTIVATALVFASTAFLASYIPARRAARIDPWTTLRHE